MEEKVIDRLDKYMQQRGINDNQVTVRANLSVGLLSNARKGNHDLGRKSIDKILNCYQDIDRVWLLTGEGEMLTKPRRIGELIEELYESGEINNISEQVIREHSHNRKHKKEERTNGIPLFELEATAGFSALYRDLSSAASDYISIPNLPPVDGAIYARGDSMSPLIASGDIVIFKKVELHPDNIIWGSIYIISYTLDGDDFTVLKYIRHSSRDGYIRLESYNPRFDPQDIPSSSITALALVKASITFHTIG